MSTTAERRRRAASGSLAVLNTGAGDICISFNHHDEAEVERAITMLLDMQKRGYAIMVRQDDGTYARAVQINRDTKSYVVIPPPPDAASSNEAAPTTERRRGRRKIEQPVRGREAVGVARSAGGCHAPSAFALLRVARSAEALV